LTQEKLEFVAPSPGKHTYMLYLMCDSYLGVDQEFSFDLNVLPQLQTEEEDDEDEDDDKSKAQVKDKGKDKEKEREKEKRQRQKQVKEKNIKDIGKNFLVQ